ncbi:efflux RND transporter periplasmic adaptor subunit [Lysobacter sp. BMK333-48F3]|uniref:efflux RND transporter periplasmic adaptor subunit n=1 Tax=Lysobacter sp. BMK333-48F3 TaxID=2867962 RepID=UPI001C8CADC2|nr:efflux RND transporter periplasmic adaptor subunit [Lysobacter sp. BMK333-48F3]MBX9401561.1 efflux RND transporter periplasmic adaptor subunit [Lysobacter sp. BMK333-48F3]
MSYKTILTVSVLCLALAACGGGGDQQGGPGGPGGQKGQVTVVTLKPQTITLTRELPGRTSASLIAEVRPQVNGIVEKRLFTEGGLVKAGQPLYQLDDKTYAADAESAKATLARAEAALNSAQLNARRSTELVKIDAVSKQDDENATATLKQARADVATGRAQVQSTGVVLGRARIASPISGRIGKSAVTAGALVTANQADALAVVQQLDPVHVDISQSSAELLALRKQIAAGTLTEASTPVTILLEDGTKYEHAGKLAFSEVTVDEGTGSFLLRVVVPNPDNILMPGMYVRAQVGTGVRQNALLVPQQGVSRDPKGAATAMVVNAKGQVEPREVQVSQAIGDKWLVEGGLKAGDKVIVEGLQKIGPGMPVDAVEKGAQPAKPDAAPAAAPKQ